MDTRIYIFDMETLVPVARPWAYWIYIGISRRIKKVQKVVPVILGEWRICNKCADCQGRQGDRARQGEDNRAIGGLEMDAWSEAAGWSCWNCQLLRDRNISTDGTWKESWDLAAASGTAG